MSTENQTNDTSFKKKGPSVNKLKSMTYMEILEHYNEYPQKNLKFNYIPNTVLNADVVTAAIAVGKKVTDVQFDRKMEKAKFLSEKDKAEGWTQLLPKNKKFSKFLQTNLHYLPENLWDKLQPFYQEGVLVGYKVKDQRINFFVHSAETDQETRKLFNEIRDPYNIDSETVKGLVDHLDEKGIDSWLTIRAKSCLAC